MQSIGNKARLLILHLSLYIIYIFIELLCTSEVQALQYTCHQYPFVIKEV